MTDRYDAILIDADDTLFDFHAAEEIALRGLLRELGIETPEAFARYRQINNACWRAFEQGTLSQEALRVKRFADFLPAFGVAQDPADVAERYLVRLSRQGMLLDGAQETIVRIAAEKPVAIVTNGISFVQHGRMDASPIRPYVKALVISGEMGCAKPDPGMIYAALRRLGCVSPSRALMVGDSLKSDMACAKNAGVDGCWFNPEKRAASESDAFRYEISDLRNLVPIALSCA